MSDPPTRPRSRPAPAADATVAPGKPWERGKLAELIKTARKNYGDAVVRPASLVPRYRHIQTGVFLLDMALLGGVPRGLCTQFIGLEGSGKTTLAMRVAGAAQRQFPDQAAVFVDAEGTFSPEWARRHGVEPDDLLLVQPPDGGSALDIVDEMLRSPEVSAVIVDSLPALVPTKEIEGSVSDDFIALQVRLLGKFCRKMTQALIDERKKGHEPALMLINQWRSQIGTFRGDPRIAPGGNALRYFHSVRVEISKRENAEGKDARGNQVVELNEHTFKVPRNKAGPSLTVGEFQMIRNPDHPLGAGFIDDAATVVTYGRRFGLIAGDGSAAKRVDGLDEEFRTFGEIAEYFYSDLDFFEDFKRRLITLQRMAMGLPEGPWW